MAVEQVIVYAIRRYSDGKYYHKSGWRDKLQDARFYQNKGYATANVRTVCAHWGEDNTFSVEEYELLPTGRGTRIEIRNNDTND